MIQRGGIHWVDLGGPVGSTLGGRPGKRRPVLGVQSQPFLGLELVGVLPSHQGRYIAS